MIKKRICIISVLIISMFSLTLSYGYQVNNIPIAGESAIVMEKETGRILYEKNIHKKLPMASTTKIVTALLAIEKIPLDKKIKINEKAQGVEGSSIYLSAKEEIKAIDLIYGLMLRSGNDSAEAIAYEISGTIEEFADLMNKRVKEIGAKNTNFENPHGLHGDKHYTTAYDLALITREALKNPTFQEIVKTKFWTADREGYKHFANKNKILDMTLGGDGVKTGYTTKSGRCLVASATRNNMQLIAVTLNDYNWFDTTQQLLDEGFNMYNPYKLFNDNQIVTSVKCSQGEKSSIKVKVLNQITIPLKEGENEKLISIMDIPRTISSPIVKGQKIGRIITYLDGNLINSTQLVAAESVEKSNIGYKIKRILRIK